MRYVTRIRKRATGRDFPVPFAYLCSEKANTPVPRCCVLEAVSGVEEMDMDRGPYHARTTRYFPSTP